MGCIVNNKTEEEIRADIFKTKTNIAPLENQTQEQSEGYLDSLRPLFTKVMVSVDTLSGKVQNMLITEPHELVERYGFASDKTLALQGRNTDKTSAKMLRRYRSKGKDELIKMNKKKDNITKAEVGTRIHQAAQDIMEYLIENDKSNLIKKNSEVPNYKLVKKNLAQIEKELGVLPSEFERLALGIKEIFEDIKKTQKSIDKNGKVRIYTEQIVYNENEDWMGTSDLLAIFSDNSFGHGDYKTISPKFGTTAYDVSKGRNEITDPSWMPYYKEEDLNLQLGAIQKTLQSKFGLGKMRFGRGIPLHVEIGYNKNKPEGEKLTGEIKRINIGTKQNKFLSQIPVGELTGIETLDRQLNTLNTIKNNLEIKLENMSHKDPRYESVKTDINNKRRLINKIILEKDATYLKYEVKRLLDKYYDKTFDLKDIDNKIVNGKANPNYLSIEDLSLLINEFKAYSQILGSSSHYMAELDIEQSDNYDEYINTVANLTYKLTNAITALEEIQISRIMTKEEIKSLEDMQEEGFLPTWFKPLSEQHNIALQKLSDWIQDSYNRTRLATQTLEKESKEQIKEVELWAKENGMSIQEAYNTIFNEETGNLVGRYTPQLFEDLKKAQKEEDFEFLKKYLKLKDNALELYESNLKTYTNKGYSAEDITDWKKRNSIDAIKLNPQRWNMYYRIDPNMEATSKYYTDGYRRLLQPSNKKLLGYYNWYRIKMTEALDMLGLKPDEKLPPNFLPWLRADMLDQVLNNGWDFKNVIESIKSLFLVREDETMFGDIVNDKLTDPVTGEIRPDVPKFFINPLKDNQGRINVGLKSRDLTKSLYVFYNMAANYNHMKNEVEPKIEALKDVVATYGVRNTDSEGRPIQTKSGLASKLTGGKVSTLDVLDRFVKYHVYGIKIQDKNTKLTKTLLTAKDIQTKKELAFAPLAWLGNYIQIKAGALFTGLNGYYYTGEILRNVSNMRYGVGNKEDIDKYKSLVYFLEPSPGKKELNAKNLSARGILKNVNWDTAFWGFRRSEETVNDDVLVALMHTHAFDKDGNLTRLINLPEGTKSLFESSKIVNGELVIEGIRNKDGEVNIRKYTALRNMARSVARDIKGSPDSQDTYAALTTLVGTLGMGFRTWLPGMLEARFGGINYNRNTNTIVQGKYRAFWSELNDTEKGIHNFITGRLLLTASKFLATIPLTTFGSQYGFKISEERAKTELQKYKDANKNNPDIQRMTLKDYMDYKQGQLRSLSAELLVIFTLMSMLMMLGGDWDDDDEPDYKKTWFGRTLFRVINRARREISFAINPDDWTSTFLRSPLPVTGLIQDVWKTVKNGFDETGDVLFGEDVEREGVKGTVFGKNKGKDKKPFGYEAMRWLPGNKLLRMFEIFDSQQDFEI